MGTISGKMEIESDYGTHKYFTFTTKGKQAVDYSFEVPEGVDEKKFHKAFQAALKVEIDNERKSAKAIKDQLAAWSSQYESRTIPYRDMTVMVEHVNGSIKAREDGMIKKFETLMKNKVVPAALKLLDEQHVSKVKWKAIFKIILYTVVALAAAAAGIAAVILTGGVAALVVVPAAIKAAGVLKNGLSKAYDEYKKLGTTYKGLNSSMVTLHATSVQMEKLLLTHDAQIRIEEKALADQRIEAGRLEGEYKLFTTISDRPDLAKMGQAADVARKKLLAEIKAAEEALAEHKEMVAAIKGVLNTAQLVGYLKKFNGSWERFNSASKTVAGLASAGDFASPLIQLGKALT